MKKSKFSEAQIAFILRQADEGTPKVDVKGAGDKKGDEKRCKNKDLRDPRSDLSTREKFT